MTTKVPLTNQYVVFWIDPKLTPETYGDNEDPELLESVSKLPFNKYVGRVSHVSIQLYHCMKTKWCAHSDNS